MSLRYVKPLQSKCIPSCYYKLINSVCSNVRAPRELCVSQLCRWQSLQGLLALTAPVFMHETSRQIVGRAGQFLSDWCQLAASLAAFSSSSSSTLLSLPSWQNQRKGFMEPHNDTWRMCSTGVIVNGGSCADSLDDGKSVGPHFGLPV